MYFPHKFNISLRIGICTHKLYISHLLNNFDYHITAMICKNMAQKKIDLRLEFVQNRCSYNMTHTLYEVEGLIGLMPSYKSWVSVWDEMNIISIFHLEN